VLASITHSIGAIFQPVFKLFALVLAFIYSIVPNYTLAITLLTILIMGILTPLTVKSTKSMIKMQSVQPEIKKLQQKYKGAENRQQLNEELMRLYKEEGVNPAGGCLPMFIQFPFLIILYDIIRGLTNISKTAIPVNPACHLGIAYTHVAPRYIPNSSKMFCNLVASNGKMMSFGMDMALKPFSHHSSIWAAAPYFIFVAVAVFLQYFQMSQMSKRNPASQANPQMAKIQKFMPILFAYIYFLIPAAVLVYMIVSSSIRIATQDVLFRTGIAQPVGGAGKVVEGKATEKVEKAKTVEIEAPKNQKSAATNRSKNKRKRKGQ
jgi:YidC/Oxa1 family membrane protein insertase